jgi:hypothetical protein
VDDDAVAQSIKASKAVNFDLSAAGQKNLTSNGVGATVIAAMKARSASKAVAAK